MTDKPDLNDRIDMATDWLWMNVPRAVFTVMLAVRKPKMLSGSAEDRRKR